jgi:hypothetical protein
MPFMHRIKKGDFVVAGVILFIVAVLFMVNRTTLGLGGAGGHASVEIENQHALDVSLLEGAPQHVRVTLPRGEAVLEIEDGKIRVLPMPRETCPLQICSSVGWIEKPGQAIVCLPNRMIITISGEAEDPLNLDGITN